MTKALENIKKGLPAFALDKKSMSIQADSTQYAGKTFFLSSPDLARIYKVLNGSYTNYNLIQLFYSIAEIFAPIDAIATRVANAKWEVRSTSDDSVIYNNKYLNKLLSQPNPLQNWQQFVYEAVVWKLVNGASFTYANVPDSLPFDYKNVSTLVNLWTYSVEVLHDVNIKILSATEIGDIVKGYNLAGYGKIPVEKVMMSQYMSLDQLDNKLIGKSPLLSAQKAITNLIATYEARGSIFVNRGALGMFVSKKTDAAGTRPLSPDEKAEAREDYNSIHGVTGGRSTIAISSLPMEWQRISMTIQELMPFEETQADAAAIYAVLNVPQDLMPTPKGATFENQRAADRQLYQNVVIPITQSLAQGYTNYLRLDARDIYITGSHDHVEVLQENRKDKAETNKIEGETFMMQFKAGIITLNDWIGKVGGTPVKSPLYNKRILEMDETDRALILTLLTPKPSVSTEKN